MEGISKNYVVVQEQPKKKGGKVRKHAANAAATAAGVGAAALAHNKMQKIYGTFANQKYWGAENTKYTKTFVAENKNILTKLKNSFASMGSKISKGLSKGFEALGEKVFSNPTINNLFEQHEISWKKENLKEFAKNVKVNKTQAAILLSGVLTALGIVGAGIYKAGKINGENK